MSNLEPTEAFPDGVPLAQIGGAYLELQEHNRSHTGIGVGMGRLMGALIQMGDEDIIGDDGSAHSEVHVNPIGEIEATNIYSKIENSAQVDVAVGDISVDLLSLTVDPVLEAVGLARWDGQEVTNGTASITNSRQDLVITNPNKYLGLLERAEGKLEANPELKGLIKETYNNLLATIWRFATAVPGPGEDDSYRLALEERLDVLGRIHPTITDFANTDDIDVQLERGTMFLNWGSKPEFKDFLVMRELGIREKGTFSAAEWHKDMSGPGYTEHWHELLQHYSGINERHGSSSDLTMLMKAEIEDILRDSIDWPEGYKGSYVESIEEARAKILTEAKQIGLLS